MSSPSNYKKVVVTELSKDFRKSTAVVEAHLPEEVPQGHVRIAITYVGINASDLNFVNGSYFKAPKLPFDAGFEAVGTVIKVGAGVSNFKEGDVLTVLQYGAFAEYMDVAAASCILVPDLKPEYTVLSLSAMTAAISIGELGRTKKGEIALVTAAAGGTGQIAVQLLKHVYGCTVIGTCSSADKAEFLKKIGCDHVVNYKTESLDNRLHELAPKGVDIVYECVGGQTFNDAVRHIAVHGRIIVIGTVSSYKTGEQVPFSHPSGTPLPTLLMVKSASLNGFFLPQFHHVVPKYAKELLSALEAKQLQFFVDHKEFKGLESIPDAVDHLYSGNSFGKVIVKVQ